MKSLEPQPSRVAATSAPRRRRAKSRRALALSSLALVALLAVVSSTSASRTAPRGPFDALKISTLSPHPTGGGPAAGRDVRRAAEATPPLAAPFSAAPLSEPQQETAPAGETVEVFAADCETPKSAFALGEVVCARVTNVPVGESDFFGIFALRKISWVNPSGYAPQSSLITTNGTFTFTLPDDAAGALGDRRGPWRVTVSSLFDATERASAEFVVRDPQNAAVDLSVVARQEMTQGGVGAGTQAAVLIEVENKGPDAAAAVEVRSPVPDHTTFFSLLQTGGPAFSCLNPNEGVGPSGTSVCSIASLPAGGRASFTAVYLVGGNVAVGTEITDEVTVTSTTTERHEPDNSSASSYKVASAPTCTITTPEDLVVDAATGQAGAVVNYTPAAGVGNCGAVSCDIPSGATFPLGTTFVTCSNSNQNVIERFSVTVNDTQTPAITCPANLTVFESTPGSGEAVVQFPQPSVTDNDPNVSVRFDPPSGSVLGVGTHEVTATATDISGNFATCTFNVTVNERPGACTITPDAAQLPTITAQCSVTVATIPTATDSCSGQVGATTNDPRSFDAPGTYTINWNYANASGGTATQTQTVIVTAGGGALSITGAPVVNVPVTPGSTACSVEIDDLGAVLNTSIGGNCADLDVTRTVSPAAPGNVFLAGVNYTVVSTVTDGTGTASVTQTLRVIDGIAPTVTAPADAAYECPGQVPAADPSQAAAADNCGTTSVTVSETSNNGAGSPASPLVITRTFTATDGSGRTASDSQVITVIDPTPPAITAPADVTVNADPVSCAVPAAGVSLGTPQTPDNCPGGSVSNNAPPSYPLGETVVTWTVTDAVGRTATATQKVTVVDTTAPVISCPTDIVVYLPPNSTAVSRPVDFAAPTATDNCGTPTVAVSHAPNSIFGVGTTTVTATADDGRGNPSSCSFNVTVLYNFAGFFSPVGNPPTLNLVNAGRAVPVKFSLSGSKGLGIFADDSPASQQVACDSSAPISNLEETVSAGGSSLSYSASNDQYSYVWKTESAWVGTCRQLVVKLNDGSSHTALFKFK